MKRKIILLLLLTPLLIVLFSIISHYSVIKLSSDRCYSEISKTPKRDVALLLGTSPTLYAGRKNPYFYYRTRACIKLYHAGKIKHILISGDNGRKDYNEPEEMMKELIKGGIPKEKITLDFAGFRTLDSVIRAKEVFGVHSMLIISQKFHNQRAIFLSRMKGINVVGYNAQDVLMKYGYRVHIREYFARSKAVLDILTFKKPKFLGKKEVIKVN